MLQSFGWKRTYRMRVLKHISSMTRSRCQASRILMVMPVQSSAERVNEWASRPSNLQQQVSRNPITCMHACSLSRCNIFVCLAAYLKILFGARRGMYLFPKPTRWGQKKMHQPAAYSSRLIQPCKGMHHHYFCLVSRQELCFGAYGLHEFMLYARINCTSKFCHDNKNVISLWILDLPT